jgi:hypothetical protein
MFFWIGLSMSERISSFFILSGMVLVVLVLWYLSVRFVRWDTGRRTIKPFERKGWVAAAIGLPLFGFALYLFTRLLKGYLTPLPEQIPGTGHLPVSFEPEPAWVITDPLPSAGKAPVSRTPETTRSPYQGLHTRYSLLVAQGPLQGQQILLKSLPAQIGRGPDSAIPLDADLNISRKHAEIYEWNGMLRIRDLESMHGTLINGMSVADQALTPGDRIMLGNTVLILRELP